MTPSPRPSLLIAASLFGPHGAPAPAPPPLDAPAPRRVYVSRRTWDGMQPRPTRVPHTAEDSARLRKAELKRRAKAAKRARAQQARLVLVRASAPPVDPTPEATP